MNVLNVKRRMRGRKSGILMRNGNPVPFLLSWPFPRDNIPFISYNLEIVVIFFIYMDVSDEFVVVGRL